MAEVAVLPVYLCAVTSEFLLLNSYFVPVGSGRNRSLNRLALRQLSEKNGHAHLFAQPRLDTTSEIAQPIADRNNILGSRVPAR
jgi:hypothetical protein